MDNISKILKFTGLFGFLYTLIVFMHFIISQFYRVAKIHSISIFHLFRLDWFIFQVMIYLFILFLTFIVLILGLYREKNQIGYINIKSLEFQLVGAALCVMGLLQLISLYSLLSGYLDSLQSNYPNSTTFGSFLIYLFFQFLPTLILGNLLIIFTNEKKELG